MINWLKEFWWIPALAIGMLLMNIEPSHAGELWAASGEWSFHPNEDHYHFNQTNYGGGFEYHISHDRDLVLGEYSNSLNRTSRYFGVLYEPFKPADRMKIGVLSGLISGYTETPKYQFVIAPISSFEVRGLGLNVIWVPSVVMAVQLKVKVW